MFLGSVCSFALIFGGMSFITSLFDSVCDTELFLCVRISCFSLFAKWGVSEVVSLFVV